MLLGGRRWRTIPTSSRAWNWSVILGMAPEMMVLSRPTRKLERLRLR